MRIGIPKEVKTLEGRVGLIPAACSALVQEGHTVYLERGAGDASGYPDEEYRRVGVGILVDAAALYGAAELVVKVKEPQRSELPLLRPGQLLFCYLHLAADPELARALAATGCTGVAFETVEEGGRLPLLAPMSDVAGRLAVQIGAHLLHQPMGGRGLLLGGLPGARRGLVVVLGAGTVGGAAAAMAAAIGANVIVFDRDRDKLERMRALGANVTALYPFPADIEQAVLRADLLVGAVLIPGARAPHLVSAEQVRQMKPGSVIVDVAVDQGGCVETTHPTSYADPTYLWEGVVHFCVTNMPGAVPRSSSQALSAALIPYVSRLAGGEWRGEPDLAAGVNVEGGRVVHPAVIEALENRRQ